MSPWGCLTDESLMWGQNTSKTLVHLICWWMCLLFFQRLPWASFFVEHCRSGGTALRRWLDVHEPQSAAPTLHTGPLSHLHSLLLNLRDIFSLLKQPKHLLLSKITRASDTEAPLKGSKLTLAASWEVRVATFSWEASSSRRSFLICCSVKRGTRVNVRFSKELLKMPHRCWRKKLRWCL